MKDDLVLTVAVEILEDGPCFGDGVVEEVVPVWSWVGRDWSVFPVAVGGAVLGKKHGGRSGATGSDLRNIHIKEFNWENGSLRAI